VKVKDRRGRRRAGGEGKGQEGKATDRRGRRGR
jgi:hypothetical protein